MDKLIKVLKACPEVAAWKITSKHKESVEAFYVLDKLETTRGTDVVDTEVTVYVDKDGKRGMSSFVVFPFMSEEELAAKVNANVYAAGFALNQFFELPKPSKAIEIEKTGNLATADFKTVLADIVAAVFKANVYEEGYLSATEFFLDRVTTRVVNSEGVDLSDTSCKCSIELIPSWGTEAEGKDDAEVYFMLRFDNFDAATVTERVDEQLRSARDRYNAVELPVKEGVKVIIQDDEVAQLFEYYSEDLLYSTKYTKSNRSELGNPVQGKEKDHSDVTGTILNMKMVPYYENAIASKAFDADGVALAPVELVKDGIATNRWGGHRFGYYLGVERTTGLLPVMVVEPGTKTFAEMAKEPYIRCVTFSGMQLDQNSGYFGGEVRLGYYFDGEKEIPVTGFAISGDMTTAKKAIVFSKDEVTREKYHGPKYLEIRDMSVM